MLGGMLNWKTNIYVSCFLAHKSLDFKCTVSMEFWHSCCCFLNRSGIGSALQWGSVSDLEREANNTYTIQKTDFLQTIISLAHWQLLCQKLTVTGTASDCQSAQTRGLLDERKWHPPVPENLLKPQISVWRCSWASALCFDSSTCNEVLTYLPSMLISQIHMQCCWVEQLQV